MSFFKPKMFLVFIFIFLLLGAFILFFENDYKSVSTKVRKGDEVSKIYHVEFFDDKEKAVAFYKTLEGDEKEMYFERSFLKWSKKQTNIYRPSKINGPVFISFSGSPYEDEEDQTLLLIRIYNKEIKNAEIKIKGKVIAKVDIQTANIGKLKGFGLMRTNNEDIYDAQFIFYNKDGEIVYIDKKSN